MSNTDTMPGSAKVFLQGTHRVRHPEHTWELIQHKLSSYGITRIADVTGLDTIGIPVMMAVRPMAKTISVSQGKGQTAVLARVSAAMEGIELWHAEHAWPATIHHQTPGDELELSYSLSDLVNVPGGLVNASTPLDWITATGLNTGRSTAVPIEAIRLTTPSERRWTPIGIRRSSNGLASGNSREEAVLHALYEVIERDCLARPIDRTQVDVASISSSDCACAELAERIITAGVSLQIHALTNPFGIPCFHASVWSQDFPIYSLGSGAHIAPEVALSRAITEAVQSRLTTITGSRDDLPPVYRHVIQGMPQQKSTPSSGKHWESGFATTRRFDDVAEEAKWLSETVARIGGAEPLLIDLSTDDDYSVVKVVLPRSKLDLSRISSPHPQPAKD